MTGAVLLVLFIAGCLTLLNMGNLLTLHVFLGMLLLGPVRPVIADPRLAVQYSHTHVAPPGTVIRQQPAAGCEVAPGSHIELTVSGGPAAGGVPASDKAR
jgi:hypothetical protein